MQPACPVFGWYLPFWQRLQLDCPVPDWYCPAGQFLQLDDPEELAYCPLWQSVHPDDALAEVLPELQEWQELDPLDDQVPAEQANCLSLHAS